VDRSSTKVELRLPLAAMRLDDGQRRRVAASLARRVTADGEVRVPASARRSQVRNRRAAEARLVELVAAALRDDAPRVPTRPSAGARAAMRAARERSQARRRERSWRQED
jgi:ribosome-associated protein